MSSLGLQLVRPSRCRMWDLHDRLGEDINDASCAALISSIQLHGQKQPVLGRRISGAEGCDIELIYGARRLYAAQVLGIDLLVDVRQIDDRAALIEMDIENRVRRDISPYERGLSYRRWLHAGYFKSQLEIAKALGISQSQVSRLLSYAELPAVVVSAFPSVHDIREEWAVNLAKLCRDEKQRAALTQRARTQAQSGVRRSPQDIYDTLVYDSKARVVRRKPHDRVIKGTDGSPIFRIAFRAKTLHLVLPRHTLTEEMLEELAEQVRVVLESPRGAPVTNGEKRRRAYASALSSAAL